MRFARRPGSPSRRASTPETVLITGGAGFIGSHLADTLLARGQHVRALDSLRRRSGRRVGKDFTFNRPPIDQEKRRRAVPVCPLSDGAPSHHHTITCATEGLF
jgi:nucleoside-diphosphate-sugar epimerase